MLNPLCFAVIAGQDLVDELTVATIARYWLEGMTLPMLQPQQEFHAKGIRGAEVVQTLRGWCVRADSSLDR